MSLTVVTKYKKDGKLFTQFSIKNPEEAQISKIFESLSSKYSENKSLELVREIGIVNFNIEFNIDDSFESNSFINEIYSKMDLCS
jgi:hypothetical protein